MGLIRIVIEEWCKLFFESEYNNLERSRYGKRCRRLFSLSFCGQSRLERFVYSDFGSLAGFIKMPRRGACHGGV